MCHYKVVIQYHTGKRKGRIITIEEIDDQDIMEILGEITQDQLANADIMIKYDQSHLSYEDFIIDRNTKNCTNFAKRS